MNKKEQIIIQRTSDNSHTLYVPELDETYHSSHGAIQEAEHVFIQNGLLRVDKQQFSVLEVGFGTGLNSALTESFSRRNNRIISYTGLETLPLGIEITKELNYSDQSVNIDKDAFSAIHLALWENQVTISDNFMVTKVNQSVQNFNSDELFDIIFYDAFGPRAQPEMWSISIFEKLYALLNSKGLLVTYCAMGQFKRDLKSCGFEVVSLPGPPGKREMTLAIKK